VNDEGGTLPIEYVRPATLAETLQFLAERGPASRLLAGGTDLLLEMQAKKVRPPHIVDISRLGELRGIRETLRGGQEVLEIGALTSMRALETSRLLQGGYLALAQAAGSVASVQIRNRATVGGNICHATPSADTAPALLALGAEVEIAGPDGARWLPLEQFFLGPGQTSLGPREVLAAFRIPRPAPRSFSLYLKQSPRKAMDIAVVGVGVQVTLDGQRPVQVRIALGAVAPVPMRACQAEAVVLNAGQISPAVMAEAARVAAAEARPIDDLRATAWYRRRMVAVSVRRAFEQIVRLSEGEVS
jgi:CO/xanthine dehydrogenase FAD-binding subunit